MNEEKIPMPSLPEKIELYLPIAFWAELLATLDRKVQLLSRLEGFGEVTVSIIVHRGKVTEVMYLDKTRNRNLAEKVEHIDESEKGIPTEKTK